MLIDNLNGQTSFQINTKKIKSALNKVASECHPLVLSWLSTRTTLLDRPMACLLMKGELACAKQHLESGI